MKNKKAQVVNSTFSKGYSYSTFLEKVGQKKNNPGWQNTNKKAQVTIFIIVSIMIVAAILAFMFFYNNKSTNKIVEIGPEQFIKKCARDIVQKNALRIMDGGGLIEPLDYINYSGQKNNYLCYQPDNYKPCYNNYPALEEMIEQEIMKATQAEIKNCFKIIKEEYNDRGFEVSGEFKEYSIDIMPGNIDIKLRANLTLAKEETALEFERFDTGIVSPLYEFIKIARDIVNAEATYCYFDQVGYMLLYPKYDIKRISYYDSRIYQIIDRQNNQKFQFAIKSCPTPAGI